MENELDKEMFDQISSLPIALIRNITLREKCPYSVFLVRMREYGDQKNYVYGHFSRSIII